MSGVEVSPPRDDHLPSQQSPKQEQVDPAMPPSTEPHSDKQPDDATDMAVEDQPQLASPSAPAATQSNSPPQRRDPAMPPPLARPASPTPEEKAAEATRKRQRAEVADEGQQRGRRMFGLLQSTLQQAKSATARPKSGAAKKREELEHKLAEKLARERTEGADKARAEKERRELRATINRIEDGLANSDSILRNRHDAKLHLAGFLCTPFRLTPPAAPAHGIAPAFAPRLPHAMKADGPKAQRPVYYKPYRLLPSQEDQIDDQLAAVRKAIRAERDDYDDSRQPRLKELAAAREQLAALNQRTARARRPSDSRPGAGAGAGAPGAGRRESEVDMDREEGGRGRERSASRGRDRSESAREGGMEVDGAAAEGTRAGGRKGTSPPLARDGGEDVAMSGAEAVVEGTDVELEY